MHDSQEVWWRSGGRSPFSFDPDKPRGPQIVTAIWQGGVIFCGPLLGLVAIDRYPLLIENRTLYVGGLASVAFWFLVTFFLNNDFPPGTPAWARTAFRAGWGLCMTGLVLGVTGIANGYRTPLVTRDAAVVAKRGTRGDRSHRTYYLEVRAWSGLREVAELDAPRDVYDRLNVPVTLVDTPEAVLEAMADAGNVRLTIGEGRFGLEWLQRVDVR